MTQTSLRPVIAEILEDLGWVATQGVDGIAETRLFEGAETLRWCESATHLVDQAILNDLESELEELREHLGKIHEIASESSTEGAAKLAAAILATYDGQQFDY